MDAETRDILLKMLNVITSLSEKINCIDEKINFLMPSKASLELTNEMDEPIKITKAKKNPKTIAIVGLAGVLCAGIFYMITSYFIPATKYSSAVAMMKNGNYADAKTKLLTISGYKDVPKLLIECDYQDAISQSNSANIDATIAKFEGLEGHKDNITKLIYQKGQNYFNDQDFTKAIDTFNQIEGYKDSGEKLSSAKDQLLSQGIESMKAGRYDDALTTFTYLDGYKNANDLIVEDKIAEAKNIISNSAPAIKNLAKDNIDHNAYSDLDKAYKLLASISDNSSAKSLLLSDVFHLHNIVGDWITDDGQRTASISQPYKDNLFETSRIDFIGHGQPNEENFKNSTYFSTVKGNRCITGKDYIDIGVIDTKTITISFSWGGPTLTMHRK